MKLSWSAMQEFLACQRRYELSHVSGLRRIKNGVEGKAMVVGSAVHDGLAATLKAMHKSGDTLTLAEQRRVGANAARDYINRATLQNKQVFDYETGTYSGDFGYYAMMADLAMLAPELVEYHLEHIGLGTKWGTVSKFEVLGMTNYDREVANADIYGTEWLLEAAVEWTIETDFPDDIMADYAFAPGDGVKGIVDAVLLDLETQEYVIVDWKVRGGFPFDEMAFMDGQVHMYAAMLNIMGADISRVCMYQIKSKTPSPASISKAKGKGFGLPNTGAASYDTTWKVWCETIPATINPADYMDEMLPKLKTDDDFTRPVFGGVTYVTNALAWRNIAIAFQSVVTARLNGKYAAIQSAKACQGCDFWRLCAGVLRTGGDASPIIEHEFTKESKEHDRSTDEAE